jgi:hypothetical protein
MASNKTTRLDEILDEFRKVVVGRHKILDSILPPLAFIVMNALAGVQAAAWTALTAAFAFTVYRLLRRQPVGYALGGLGGVLLAIGIAWLSGRAEGYFVPQLVSSVFTATACLISVVIRHPLVAYTSHITRRWPLEWYWQARVRPAYSEVTIIWAAFFGLRALVQFLLLQVGETLAAGVFSLLMGWPALIALLTLSYIYGLWRLRALHGPSVEEFLEQAPPPWEGQRKGF